MRVDAETHELRVGIAADDPSGTSSTGAYERRGNLNDVVDLFVDATTA